MDGHLRLHVRAAPGFWLDAVEVRRHHRRLRLQGTYTIYGDGNQLNCENQCGDRTVYAGVK